MFELLILVKLAEATLPWWVEVLAWIFGSGGLGWGIIRTIKKNQESTQKQEVIELLKKTIKHKDITLDQRDSRISDLEAQVQKLQDAITKEIAKARKETEEFWKTRLNDLMEDHDEQMDKIIQMLTSLNQEDHSGE